MSDRLLKSSETASMLATTEKTLAVWRCRGYGPPFIKIGKPGVKRAGVRYRQSDIEAYMKNPTTEFTE